MMIANSVPAQEEAPEMRVLPNQCKKHSQPVEDIKWALHLAKKMQKLCNEPLGKYPSALALAHCQVDHDNPLRFFVLADGQVIINPKILIGTRPIKRVEGCYSFPYRDVKKTSRFDSIGVEYTNEKGKRVEKSIEGELAHIFQHEIDHFNGKSIYS